MKAFTAYQPYAYAIVAGLKGYETRPRRTNIRGRVAVHAGKGKPPSISMAAALALPKSPVLHYGAVLGTVEIVDCLPVEEVIHTLTERERALGDYSPGCAGNGQRKARLVELGRGKRKVKNTYCGRPEWADKDGCQVDNPNEEMTSCVGCVWLKETEGQE